MIRKSDVKVKATMGEKGEDKKEKKKMRRRWAEDEIAVRSTKRPFKEKVKCRTSGSSGSVRDDKKGKLIVFILNFNLIRIDLRVP